MKARAVAGDTLRATSFLSELQQLDWRRYGQSGRSRRELAVMRARLEKEQGRRDPLKAGPGGYYDIDFAIMYYRLKGAGMFYKSLTTPERIEIVEKMGHLERDDAAFLREAATFYRALDHGLRISTGHAEGRLPARVSSLANLVRRWAPVQSTLHDHLRDIQHRTRAFYDRVFS
jgi:glutamate-ammonia-ligase adenylyltransferase